MTHRLEIQICPREPSTSPYLMPGGLSVSTDSTITADLLDCTGSGDAEQACKYVLSAHNPRFVIVARNAAGEYENRDATEQEIEQTCRAIYFESESDFSDLDLAKVYLIWDAAHQFENETESEA